MSTKTEAKRIVESFADTLRAGWINDPASLRVAAEHIKGPAFNIEDDERDFALSFAALLEARADKREKAIREAFAPLIRG